MLLQSEVVDAALDAGWPLGGWGTMIYAPMLKWWSPMSIGAWALMLFGLCSFLSLVGTIWPGGGVERVLSRGAFGRGLQIVGSLVGFFVASYTGVLLTATNQPLWSLSDWIGPLFLASAASTGIATITLAGPFGRAMSPATHERLERAALWSLGLELFVFLIFLASLGMVLPLALYTPPGWILVFGTLAVGLLAPLALHLGVGAHQPLRIAAASVCALVGGFALRYGLLKAAPALLDMGPPVLLQASAAGALWLSITGIGLLLVTLLLAVLIPWVLKRQWQLDQRQAAVAAAVSVLVCIGVTLYAVRPASSQPILEQFRLPGFSPEDGRPRGGGVGASVLNRPDDPQPPSKITGVLPHEP
jgi:formate-dependent nitrite reductase membrane component NrfD